MDMGCEGSRGAPGLALGRWVIAVVLAGALALTGFAGLYVPSASADATINCDVNTQKNLQSALNAGGTSTITMATANCLVTLTGTLTVPYGANITIDGNGLVLDGVDHSFDIINIDTNYGQDASALTLNGVTVENGQNGIYDVYQISTVTLNQSTVQNNICPSTAGNCFGILAGGVVLNRSVVSGNLTWGIVSDLMPATIVNSLVNNNGYGGISGNGASVANSTIADNYLWGIYSTSPTPGNPSAPVYLTNSTISGNDNNIAMVSDGSSVQVTLSTIAGTNLGIVAYASDVTVSITGTLLKNQVNCSQISTTDNGYNLASDTSCGLNGTGSQQGLNAAQLGLQPLAANNGLLAGAPGNQQVIPTMALSGGLAVDLIPVGMVGNQLACIDGNNQPIVYPPAAAPAPTGPVVTDERGVVRPQGNRCDAGAFEAQLNLVPLAGSTSTVRQGYFAMIRFAVISGGTNISNRQVKVTSVQLVDQFNNSIAFNHPLQFGRFGGQNGYQLTINTRSLHPGGWTLVVTIQQPGSAPLTQGIPFTIQ